MLQSILVAACFRYFAAMARSYRGSSSRGAPEHELALASTNVGLHGPAFGRSFEKKHGARIRRLIQELLCGHTNCAAVFFCEVGNVDHLLTNEGKMKFERCIIDAFQEAGAAEHEKKRDGEP